MVQKLGEGTDVMLGMGTAHAWESFGDGDIGEPPDI